jgi:hypothetical protein
MFNKGKLAALFASATMAGALMSPNANAASGDVDIDITFPPLIILYYFTDITVNVDAADLQTVLANTTAFTGCTAAVPGDDADAAELECGSANDPNLTTADSATGTTLSWDVDITGDALVAADPVSVPVTMTLENSWAVRALTPNTLTATSSVTGTELTNLSVTPVNPDASLTLGGANDNIGDISFQVDLGSADLNDLNATGTVTITVTEA